MPGRRHFRLVVSGLFLLAVWHSLGASNPGNWMPLRSRQTLVMVQHLNSTNPVHCYNSSYCCGVWNISADSWWIHRPDWQVVHEDNDSFCFAPISNATKRAFLQNVHWMQWHINTTTTIPMTQIHPEQYNYTVNCSDMRASVNINSGYGATTQWLLHSFYEAFTQGKPFQTIQKWPWLYANSDSTWINCTVHDQTCFFLPISPCSRINKEQPRYEARPNPHNETQEIQNLWLEEYLFRRPKQILREKMHHLRLPIEPELKTERGCIAMHVRRGDVGAPQPPFRRYAAVQEYLDLLPPSNKTQTIFLLTDDASTIQEVQKYHLNSNYHWVYTDKIRVHGVERGFNNHIPFASDGPTELAYIIAEIDMASSYCDTLVFGNSGYAYVLREQMLAKGRLQGVTQYYLETKVEASTVHEFVGKPIQRADSLMQQVNNQYRQQQQHE